MSQKTNTYFGTSIIVFIVVGLLIGLILKLLAPITGGNMAAADMSPAAIEARIKPVGQLNTGAPVAVAAPAAAPAAPAAAGRSGETLVKSVCFACHGTGAAGAPKIGDKAAWSARIAQGADTLLQHAKNGFQGKTGVMPPKGTCGNCTDSELKSAIEYMTSQSK